MMRSVFLALAAASVALAPVAAADCPPGWYWDVDVNQCVNAPNPILGPVGPAGVGGAGPVAGPVGPVGVGGVLGPAGPIGRG